ncbi:hypothetical protein GS498_20460 [Rhodococcus hoagii]|nr:hypothetical protein [Prescottella equi]
MTVDVAIPWRKAPDRIAAFERVKNWYEHHGFNVITADSRKHKTFNVSASRNMAVAKATSDVIVVADADTIPDLAALLQAVEECRGEVIYPFDRYRYLSPEHVDTVDLHAVTPEREFQQSVGGLLVTTRASWDVLGGMDEGFRQWGYDDNAFYAAAATLVGARRIPGTVYAFGHDADRDLSESNPGKSRFELYKFAQGRPEIMRELVYRG